jgi:hypothetical protein
VLYPLSYEGVRKDARVPARSVESSLTPSQVTMLDTWPQSV